MLGWLQIRVLRILLLYPGNRQDALRETLRHVFGRLHVTESRSGLALCVRFARGSVVLWLTVGRAGAPEMKWKTVGVPYSHIRRK